MIITMIGDIYSDENGFYLFVEGKYGYMNIFPYHKSLKSIKKTLIQNNFIETHKQWVKWE